MPQSDFEPVEEQSANGSQSSLQATLPVTETLAVAEPPQDVKGPQSEADWVPSFAPQGPGGVSLHPMFLVAGLAAAIVIVGGIGAYLALSHRASGGNTGENVARSTEESRSRSPDAGVPQTRNSIADATRRAAIAAAIAADAKQTESERVSGKVPDSQVRPKNPPQTVPESVERTKDEKDPAANARPVARSDTAKREQEPRRRESSTQVVETRPQVTDSKPPQTPAKAVARSSTAADTPKLQLSAHTERANQPVCADSPNLFSREMCLWRECEKQEYRQTADCSRFSRSAN